MFRTSYPGCKLFFFIFHFPFRCVDTPSRSLVRPEGPCPWEEGFEPPRPSDMKDYEVFSPFSNSFLKMLKKMFEIEKYSLDLI